MPAIGEDHSSYEEGPVTDELTGKPGPGGSGGIGGIARGLAEAGAEVVISRQRA